MYIRWNNTKKIEKRVLTLQIREIKITPLKPHFKEMGILTVHDLNVYETSGYVSNINFKKIVHNSRTRRKAIEQQRRQYELFIIIKKLVLYRKLCFNKFTKHRQKVREQS